MPSRNIVKNFDVDSMYHAYNRGNDKRIIFHDERDYTVFLSFLKYALLSDEDVKQLDVVDSKEISESTRFNLRRLGLHGQIELVAFCLMPNHFHLLLYQNESTAMTALMRSIATGYVLYYNKRYNRSGSLFEGVYRASKIEDDSYWQHISRYIHLNPLDIGANFDDYAYSSYQYYTGEKHADWVQPAKANFSDSAVEYRKFIMDWIPYRAEVKEISKMLANTKN